MDRFRLAPPGSAIVLGSLCVVVATAATPTASTHPAPHHAPHVEPEPIALVNANVVDVRNAEVQPGSRLLIEGGRIVKIGSPEQVALPPSASIVDVEGGYVLPGLVDTHVHYDDIEQATLYLAHGVTTVLNLRGEPRHLEWRHQIELGRTLSPTLYTSGPFVNEPYFRTADEVEAAVREQARLGYDMIKVHGHLAPEAYDRLHDVAAELGLPVIGHATRRRGLEPVLAHRQHLAHAEEFLYAHFAPFETPAEWWATRTAGGAMALLAGTVLVWVGARGVRWARRLDSPRPSVRVLRATRTALVLAALVPLFAIGVASALPLALPTAAFGSPTMPRLLTALGAAIAILAGLLCLFVIGAWRDPALSGARRVGLVLAAVCAIAFLFPLAHWIPLTWRTSDAGLEKLASRVREAGIWVIPNHVAYDAIVRQVDDSTFRDFLERPELQFLAPEVQTSWGRRRNPYRQRFPSPAAWVLRDNLRLLERLTLALHEAGVPLLMGTDAMNPGAIPGVSAAEELELLVESGLSPRDALETATIRAAEFLGAETVIGAVEPGLRADLLVLEANPLEDITALRHPRGVMLRGRWFPAERLDAMLFALADLHENEVRFLHLVDEEGFDHAAKMFEETRRLNPSLRMFREETLNSLGYDRLEAGEVDEAIRVFELNTRAYPDSPNVWDSLGEAFMVDRQRERAIRSYETALMLYPDSENAARMLERLRTGTY